MKGSPKKAAAPLCPACGGKQSLGSQVPCQGTAEALRICSAPYQCCACSQPPSCSAAVLFSKNRCFALQRVGEDFFSLINKDIPHGWSNPDLREIRSKPLASANQFTPHLSSLTQSRSCSGKVSAGSSQFTFSGLGGKNWPSAA